MRVVDTIKELEQIVALEKALGKEVGLVPTMGALHAGHISLVKQAHLNCDFTVVSIFVNPNQFNNKEDLDKYPRDIEADLIKLENSGCSIVFTPNVKEVYPEPDMRKFSFGALETVMEGEHRPGHFNGVAQIVSKLFDMVQPHKAFFGLKDFQQLAVIRNLVEQLKSDIEIVACSTVRESDGLAMSSRNVLLTPENRKNAPIIARSLTDSCNFVPKWTVAEVAEHVIQQVNLIDGLDVEYFDIVDGNTLQKVDKWSDSDYIVGCIAVFAGKIRLIDNIIYTKLSS